MTSLRLSVAGSIFSIGLTTCRPLTEALYTKNCRIEQGYGACLFYNRVKIQLASNTLRLSQAPCLLAAWRGVPENEEGESNSGWLVSCTADAQSERHPSRSTHSVRGCHAESMSSAWS